jgi:hypothetical protein
MSLMMSLSSLINLPTTTKLYKHGGLSLMEMLTPWVVLEVIG